MEKILNKISMLQKIASRQRGAVLMVMLVILVVGAAAILVSSLNSGSQQLARARMTTEALAQAKEALIGYAITYNDTHSNVNGFLPCPDQGQSLNQDGLANSSCSVTNVSAIGKLPWKTLGLPPLRDGNGECLWYAVSGTYKNNPDTNLMNWDNNGLFQIMSPDGVSYIAGSTADTQPVAVIISPGAPIGTQTRTTAANSPSCKGNYNTSNYLDNDTIHGINNASISLTANTVTKFISGEVRDLTDRELVNDRLLFITRDDIFNAIKKRLDFGNNVSLLLNIANSACLTALPPPKTLDFTFYPAVETSVSAANGSLYIGRIPRSCFPTPLEKWQDNILYAKCTSGANCLSVNGVNNCRGMIIFSGERNSGQLRNTNAEKNNWGNYLEDTPNPNLSAFISGSTIFTGAQVYTSSYPSTDIWRCIP